MVGMVVPVVLAFVGVVEGAGVGVVAIAWAIKGLGAIGGVLAGAGVGIGAVAAIAAAIAAVEGAETVVVAGALVGAGATAGLGVFLAWRALAGDEKHDFIRIPAIAFAAIGGTSFWEADLTDANFTNTTLKSTDFRGATLTRTCWRNVREMDRAGVGDSILTQKAVRELLTTGKGYDKSYLGANLRGAHLVGAILTNAILKEAEISNANFQEAELEGANLTNVQAVGTDFTGAKLTGACLESWKIDSTTKLEEVDCQYIFLLEHPDKNGSRERRPHDADTFFEPGDLAKLYQRSNEYCADIPAES
jgi:uncharacterized protein YjbI with pentapeptide repeats